MSVPKSLRSTSKLIVLERANDLAEYTINICSNEKNFPKRYRWCLTGKIVDCVIDITGNVTKANVLRKNEPGLDRMRHEFQDKALAETYELQNYITIAYKVFSIDADRLEYWSRLVLEVQSLIRSWMEHDNK